MTTGRHNVRTSMRCILIAMIEVYTYFHERVEKIISIQILWILFHKFYK